MRSCRSRAIRGPFLVRADGPEPGEPAGVVEGQSQRRDESLQESAGTLVERSGIPVLECDEAHDRLAGGQDAVESRA